MNNNKFNFNCENKSIKLNNEGYIIQRINKVGEKGDIFVFGGYAFYENYQSSCTFNLRLHSELGIEEFKFTFDPNNPNEQYLMNKAKATEDYYLIEFIASNNNDYSYVYLDNLALYKEGYGINITYNDLGYVEDEINEVTGETKHLTYDEKNYVKTVTTNGETVTYNYKNNRLSEVIKNNITTRFERDSNGNIISIISKANNEDEIYASNSTQYTADGVFVDVETDNLGNITTYNYSYLTGLIDDIIKDNGVTTSYEYFSNGKLKSETTGNISDRRTISYSYTNGRLEIITTGGLTYVFSYNDYGDVKSISVGGVQLLENVYKNEIKVGNDGVYSGLIDHTNYSYGTITFGYDDELRVNKIYNDGYLVKEYAYNDYGSVVKIKSSYPYQKVRTPPSHKKKEILNVPP